MTAVRHGSSQTWQQSARAAVIKPVPGHFGARGGRASPCTRVPNVCTEREVCCIARVLHTNWAQVLKSAPTRLGCRHLGTAHLLAKEHALLDVGGVAVLCRYHTAFMCRTAAQSHSRHLPREHRFSTNVLCSVRPLLPRRHMSGCHATWPKAVDGHSSLREKAKIARMHDAPSCMLHRR